jgi:LacI family transcriptional regulator
MNKPFPKPQTTQDLIVGLDLLQDNLGKGGRRLARFFIENTEATALLSTAEIAGHCGVHASSVVRLAQALGFSGYKELQAVLQKGLSPSLIGQDDASPPLNADASSGKPLRLVLLAESGQSFNMAAHEAAKSFHASTPTVEFTTESRVSHMVNPYAFAERIQILATECDGLILVAREHPAINNAVRDVIKGGTPVICLTSDLPSSGRTAYVGSDQFASGATAGWLCGRFLDKGKNQNVLLVSSVPFRCQLDREQGFRQILRAEFPSLSIEEKVSSDESPDIIYEAVRRFVAKNGPPAAIYNVSGANLGIGRALEADGLVEQTVFIGHELNDNSRKLLADGIMDLTIGHSFEREIAVAVESIQMSRNGIQPVNTLTQSLIFSRHNCTAT